MYILSTRRVRDGYSDFVAPVHRVFETYVTVNTIGRIKKETLVKYVVVGETRKRNKHEPLTHTLFFIRVMIIECNPTKASRISRDS